MAHLKQAVQWEPAEVSKDGDSLTVSVEAPDGTPLVPQEGGSYARSSTLTFNVPTGSTFVGFSPVVDLELELETSLYEFLVTVARRPDRVRWRDRAWRARERAANPRPLSDKVSSRGGRVEEGPKAKPRGKSK